MAQSIFTLLDSLETKTSVPALEDSKGNVIRKAFGMVAHTLPREGLPTSKQFESKEELLAWATDNNCLLECLQAGIQARIIDYRAIFKGMKKDDVWTPEYGQANVDNAVWKIAKRPENKKSDQDIASNYLASLTPEELKKFMEKV